MESSIAFNPEVDDRALDREVKKIDRELGKTGDITPSIDSGRTVGGTGGGALTGVGEGGPGIDDAAMAGGAAGGIKSLSSKIPKSVAGVSVASAMPVALAGAVGVGMASKMNSASAHLQTSTSLLGTAVDIFFRPFGNFLGKILRPTARELLGMAVGLNRNISANGLVVGGVQSLIDGVNSLPGSLSKVIVRTVGQGLEGLFGDTAFFDAMQSFAWDNHIPDVRWDDVLGGALDFVSEQWPGWPDVKGAFAGWPSPGELASGLDWPSAGALASGLEWPASSDLLVGLEWPTLTSGSIISSIDWPALTFDAVLEALMSGGGDGGSDGGSGGGGSTDGGGGVERPPKPTPRNPNGHWSWSPSERTWRWVQSSPWPPADPGPGGDPGRGGTDPADPDQPPGTPGGGGRAPPGTLSSAGNASGGGTRRVESKLDDMNRNLKRLSRDLKNMGISVDGEKLGRVSTNARQDRLSDTNALIF